MGIVIKYCILLLAACFAMVGVRQLQQLCEMRVPVTAYRQAEGTLVRVERHIKTGAEPGSRHVLYSLVFRYRVDHGERTAQAISPFCDYCSAAEVLRVTGKAPERLAAGDSLKVFVLKDRPELAYLALPTAAEIRSQWWEVGLLLLIVPGALVAVSRLDWAVSTSTKKN